MLAPRDHVHVPQHSTQHSQLCSTRNLTYQILVNTATSADPNYSHLHGIISANRIKPYRSLCTRYSHGRVHFSEGTQTTCHPRTTSNIIFKDIFSAMTFLHKVDGHRARLILSPTLPNCMRFDTLRDNHIRYQIATNNPYPKKLCKP